MALTVTGFSNTSLSYKIATESNASDSLSSDIFGGSGTLYAIDFDNQSSNPAFLKIYLRSGTVTVGTTQPDLMLHLEANKASTLQLPAGLAFTQLSFWVTDAAPTSDTGDPGTVVLTFLCA
jgi:hypothetical protein